MERGIIESRGGLGRVFDYKIKYFIEHKYFIEYKILPFSLMKNIYYLGLRFIER